MLYGLFVLYLLLLAYCLASIFPPSKAPLTDRPKATQILVLVRVAILVKHWVAKFSVANG